jgi:hypothetical protein
MPGEAHLRLRKGPSYWQAIIADIALANYLSESFDESLRFAIEDIF